MASRLIDKLLENPYTATNFYEALKRSHVVTADNVVKYLYSENPGEFLKERLWDHLPRVTPPFRTIFIQAHDPSDNPPEEIGWLIDRVKTDDGWELTIHSFSTHLRYVPRWGGIQVELTQEGLFIEPSDHQINVWANPDFIKACRMTPEEAQDWGDVLSGRTLYALWTLAFMNTKNIIMEAVEPNASENKRRAKHGKLPLMRYHVLKIKPMGREAGHDQGGTHASPALHIRRGHFKTYTDAAPLFGKLVGTFWVDQHIAGKKSDRVVVKDYEVLAPEPA